MNEKAVGVRRVCLNSVLSLKHRFHSVTLSMASYGVQKHQFLSVTFQRRLLLQQLQLSFTASALLLVQGHGVAHLGLLAPWVGPCHQSLAQCLDSATHAEVALLCASRGPNLVLSSICWPDYLSGWTLASLFPLPCT